MEDKKAGNISENRNEQAAPDFASRCDVKRTGRRILAKIRKRTSGLLKNCGDMPEDMRKEYDEYIINGKKYKQATLFTEKDEKETAGSDIQQGQKKNAEEINPDIQCQPEGSGEAGEDSGAGKDLRDSIEKAADTADIKKCRDMVEKCLMEHIMKDEHDAYIHGLIQAADAGIAAICRREIELEKKKYRTFVTLMITVGVFFACLTIYTTAMTLNNIGWLNSLSSSLVSMHSAIDENSALKLQDEIQREHMGKTTQPSAQYPGDTDTAAQHEARMVQTIRDMQAAGPGKTAEGSSGITYKMYVGAPLADRIGILSSHFGTNTALIEYMLRTMAANSGAGKAPKTPDQIRANLQAILDTEAGKKIQITYSVWQAVKNNPQALAEIDRRLIENRFYGLPFTAAVETALIDEAR